MTVESRVASLVGAFLSVYDETAVEGVERLQLACAADSPDREVVDALLEDAPAVDAFMGLFARSKCPVAPVMRAAAALLSSARKASRALLTRLLLTSAPRQRLRDSLNRLAEPTLEATVAAMGLYRALLDANARQTAAKMGKQVPLESASFSEVVPFAVRAVRPARVRLMCAFLRARHSDVVVRAVLQHGVLTRLTDDLAELAKVRGAERDDALLAEAVATVAAAFVDNEAVDPSAKRALLTAQRGVMKALSSLLALPALAEPIAAILRRLTNQITEPSRDYALLKDSDSSRMPNFVLFQLLRYLRPKQRAIDAHLIVYVLHRCPDLYRPYLSRVAKKLPEYDGTLSASMSAVAVCNVLGRLFLCPLPTYLERGGARMVREGGGQHSLFDITPEAAADEVVPPWFREAAHRQLISQGGNLLLLTFVLQCMQAALDRAARVKAALALIARRRCADDRAAAASRAASAAAPLASATVATSARSDPLLDAVFATDDGEAFTAVDADAFMAQFERLLQERLPQREVVHGPCSRLVQALTTTTTQQQQQQQQQDDDAKQQFVLQRVLLYLRSAAHLLNWRQPWNSLMPRSAEPWAAPVPVAVRRLAPATVSALCALVVNNMRRRVPMPKVLTVSGFEDKEMGAAAPAKSNGHGKKGGGKKDKAAEKHSDAATSAPLAMELAYWAAERMSGKGSDAAAADAIRDVARCLIAVVRQHVPTAPAPSLRETLTWLAQPAADLTLLVLAIQHGASHAKATDGNGEAGDLLLAATTAPLTALARLFSAAASSDGSSGPSPVRAHVAAHLGAFAATVKRVQEALDAERPAPKIAALLPPPADVVPLPLRAEPAAPPQSTNADTAAMLRRAADDVAHRLDQHSVVIDFFGQRRLPPAVDNAGAAVAALWRAALAAAHAKGAAAAGAHVLQALTAAPEDDAKMGAHHRCGAWIAAHALNTYLPTAAQGDPASAPLVTAALAQRLLPALADATAVADAAAASDSLGLCGHLVLRLVVTRHLRIFAAANQHATNGSNNNGAPSAAAAALDADVVRGLQASLLAVYGGSLSVADRLIFAVLALLDDIEAAAPQSSSAATDAVSSLADDDNAAVADDDDNDGDKDVVEGAASDADEAASDEASDDEDDDEHPVVRDSVILGRGGRGGARRGRPPQAAASGDGGPPRQRGPRAEQQGKKPAGAADDATTRANGHRRSPACLAALRRARFMIGGIGCLASATPEVEVLTSFIESCSDGYIVKAALRMPLRIITPVAADASLPALRLVFPDAADRSGAHHGRGHRWYAMAPDADGTYAPYDCDPVSGDVWDPRFMLPLAVRCIALRFRHAAPVPATIVARLAPWFVRGLSCLDGTLRRTALDALALIYRSLHPLPRLIVNAVRLQLQRHADVENLRGAPPRLLAVHSAHFVLAFQPVTHAGHAMHQATAASLNLPDELAVPMQELLFEFPTSAVVGMPNPDKPEELTTTPHLRRTLEQLRYSCVCWQDYAFLTRRRILRLLCVDASLLQTDIALRASVLQAIRGLCLCQADAVSINAAVQEHVYAWLLGLLAAVERSGDFAALVPGVASLLRELAPFFRTGAAHRAHARFEAERAVQYGFATGAITRAVQHDLQTVVRVLPVGPAAASTAAVTSAPDAALPEDADELPMTS